jgi:hypothetical protein
MKIQFVNVLKKVSLLFAILLVTVVASAQGQTLASRVKVDIPFEFSIGDKKLPAGKYSVGRLRQNTDDVVISVEDEGGRPKAIRMSIPVVARDYAKNGMLVFHRYGDQYFLYRVWPVGGQTGRQFPKSRSEREIQENLASNRSLGNMTSKVSVETVTITGSLQ